jgi:hypothetical protein
VGGIVIQLGARRSIILCWLLLALGSGILVAVSLAANPWLALLICVAFIFAVVFGSRSQHRKAMFYSLIAVVVVDVAALVIVTAIN